MIRKEKQMKYYSTRDTKKQKFESAQVIKQGLAADGGLFIPETIPTLDSEDIKTLCGMSYPERAATVLSRFLPIIPMTSFLLIARLHTVTSLSPAVQLRWLR